MTPSGPNNRLLKGDVLAYLGSVSSSYPADLSGKIAKLTHLDLSNIKIALPPAAPKSKEAAPSLEAIPEDLEVAVPISMKAVIEVQQRIESTLGVFLPLSTFIARATDLANENLPRSKTYQPTADELFNQVLGLDKLNLASDPRGSFLPQMTAHPGTSPKPKTTRSSTKKNDIIDILSGKSTKSRVGLGVTRPAPGISASVNVFSLKVRKG